MSKIAKHTTITYSTFVSIMKSLYDMNNDTCEITTHNELNIINIMFNNNPLVAYDIDIFRDTENKPYMVWFRHYLVTNDRTGRVALQNTYYVTR